MRISCLQTIIGSSLKKPFPVAMLLLAACSSPNIKIQDAPSVVSKQILLNTADAVPRYETVGKAGNSNPYSINNISYHLLPASEGYQQAGTASWYGTKFHGRNTANGEVYNMHAMTAAHKTLPIPCYVRVTNTLNQRQVIVRVNDRGPFHGDRLIDLSYAAAVKLGFEDRGTAPVFIEVVTSDSLKKETQEVAQSRSPQVAMVQEPIIDVRENLLPIWYLQAGAFSDSGSAEALQARLKFITSLPVVVMTIEESNTKIHKVRIGPSTEHAQLLTLQREMLAVRMGQPFLVKELVAR